MINKYTKIISVLMLTILLTGCATTATTIGVGTVMSTKQIRDERFKPHDSTVIGAETGAASGAIAGAIYGTIAGTTAAASLVVFGSSTAPLMAGIILTGAGIGAISGGISGGMIGGGLGYAVDVSDNQGLYEYTVKQDNEKHPLTVVQHSSLIPENTRVEILQKNHATFIKAVN